MRVSVVGPGAMGCVFAGRLTLAGIKATLVDYKADRVERLKKSGIIVEADSISHTVNPGVSSSVPAGQDLILIFVKAYCTPELKLPSGPPVLTLQNGLGNVEQLCAQVGSPNVLAGTTTEAATLVREGHVSHVASGTTTFGSWTSCPTDAASDALTEAGFKVELTESPGQTIWEKLAINAGINPLTALLGVPNGAVLEAPTVRQLMRDLVVEAVKVASTEGYRFNHSVIELAENMCRDTAENISSMLQDVRAGKQTEIEAISGEILRRAEEAALPTPRTRVVWQLLKGMEAR